MPLLHTEKQRVVLASQSPRRIELLKKIISNFEVKVSKIEENNNGVSSPRELVEKLSRQKAEQVANDIAEGIIIGADSVVVYQDNILGKPRNPDDSRRMLSLLSGKLHQVYTGFTVLQKPDYTIVSGHEVTRVKFRELEMWEIDKYIASGQSSDKAGAYGIQDDAAVFVESVNGCYYNVVGLPITRLFLVLKRILQ
ncbi:MAG: Maf family protein [bacterium]|jgi:septum formation protein|nr:Maf family protein [bacterium]